MKLYSSMRSPPVTNNGKGQQCEITLNVNRLKLTSHNYIAYVLLLFFYYYVRRNVLFLIHAANNEASKFVFLSVMENYS